MILALGINHKTAPVAVRERCAFTRGEATDLIPLIAKQCGADELILLSTCNRTEFYAHLSDPALLLREWQRHKVLTEADLSPYLYCYHEDAAVRHMMRVAAGLDSMVLGEGQILNQLKGAYDLAESQGTLGRYLQRLLQKSFRVAKEVRSSTGITRFPVSVASSSVKLAKQLFTDLSQAKVLLMGAGETIELVAQHLKAHGVRDLCFANRSFERAEALAKHLNGTARSLEAAKLDLAEFDIIMTAMSSNHPVLLYDEVANALKKHKRHMVFMVDLGVPRNIDPALASHEDVYLYNLDDLQKVVDHNLGTREKEALLGEVIIERYADQFMGWLHAHDAASLIREYRQSVEQMKTTMVAKALKEIETGVCPKQVVNQLGHRIVQKLLHHPSKRLTRAGEAQEKSLVQAASELLIIES